MKGLGSWKKMIVGARATAMHMLSKRQADSAKPPRACSSGIHGLQATFLVRRWRGDVIKFYHWKW